MDRAQQATNQFADAMAAFTAELDDAEIPADAQDEAAQLRSLAAQIEAGLRSGPSPETQALLFQFDTAFQNLVNALNV